MIIVLDVLIGLIDLLVWSIMLYNPFFKRLYDIVFSLIFIVFFSWLYVLVATIVRIKIGKPVLFRHQRPGKDERLFNLYKFRSMTNEKDENGNLLPDEKRLIPFGIFLRSTSLDELPEVFLVLTGKMSFVGPRPLEVYFLPYYTEREHHRHDVRPGITGLAQINGRNNISWEEKFEYDLQYVANVNFIEDLRIILTTIIKVFKRIDVVEEGGAVIKDFNIEREEQNRKGRIDNA